MTSLLFGEASDQKMADIRIVGVLNFCIMGFVFSFVPTTWGSAVVSSDAEVASLIFVQDQKQLRNFEINVTLEFYFNSLFSNFQQW